MSPGSSGYPTSEAQGSGLDCDGKSQTFHVNLSFVVCLLSSTLQAIPIFMTQEFPGH